MIYPKQTKTLLLVPKVLPRERNEGDMLELEKLNMEFYWKEKVRDTMSNLP